MSRPPSVARQNSRLSVFPFCEAGVPKLSDGEQEHKIREGIMGGEWRKDVDFATLENYGYILYSKKRQADAQYF